MRIKLAVLESDKNYLIRLVGVFSTEYADRLEVHSYTDDSNLYAKLEESRIDVLLASDSFEIDPKKIPGRTGFAYLVNMNGVEMVRNQRALCKYQKPELIYKTVLSMYSEKADVVPEGGDGSARLIAFMPVSGGAGASTVAAACAVYFAQHGSRVLYLNLETTGSSNSFFNAEGTADMNGVIYALKSKTGSLGMRLESSVRQDPTGVNFFAPSPVALDMLEMNNEDKFRLLDALRIAQNYDFIILDLDFSLSKDARNLLRRMNRVVWVGSGSEISNEKLVRAYQALSIVEESESNPITDRLLLIYNQFSNSVGTVTDCGITLLGGFPKVVNAKTPQVLAELAAKNLYEKLR